MPALALSCERRTAVMASVRDDRLGIS
jgi:hypothetical protein